MFIHVGDLHFFYTQVAAAKKYVKTDLPLEVDWYLVNILYTYATKPPEAFALTLVEQFRTAVEMPDKWKYVAYKTLGDNALMKGSVFQDSLRRFGLSQWYCVDMGRNGYAGAAATAPNKFLSDLYRSLSDNMFDCIKLAEKAASLTEAKVDGNNWFEDTLEDD